MKKQHARRVTVTLLLSFAAFAAATAVLVSATFAWLAISRTPIVSDLGLTVMTESRLEIAPDQNGQPGEWDVSLDLSDLLADLAPLKPVTYSKINRTLYATLYDVDGRHSGKSIALSDAVNANVKTTDTPAAVQKGYYVAVDFWVRGSQNAAISLSAAKEVREGKAGSGTFVIGNPLWNEQTLTHDNGGKGLESAIRFGFRCRTTDLAGNQIGNARFVIYEPNADAHVNAPAGYIETVGIDGGSLIEQADLIRQTASQWNETAPVLQNDVVYTLGDFVDNPFLFDITPSTMQKVTLYVWLEGRDIDCLNAASAVRANLLGCIQLTSEKGEWNTGIGRD